jgi:hypothetical protein
MAELSRLSLMVAERPKAVHHMRDGVTAKQTLAALGKRTLEKCKNIGVIQDQIPAKVTAICVPAIYLILGRSIERRESVQAA